MGCGIHTVVEIKQGAKWVGLEECPQEFDERNYALFSFLADVRNGFNTKGFKPKGLPDDISEKTKEIVDLEEYHSKSFLTLEELINADKTDYYLYKCRIVRSFWKKFKELGGVLPDGMKVEEDFKVSSIVDALALAMSPEVIISWDLPEEEKKENSLYKGIEALKELANKNSVANYDEIRIVFGFDS